MRTERSYPYKKAERRTVSLKKAALCLLTFLLIAGFLIGPGSRSASASDHSGNGSAGETEQKYYKSIEIKSGDTLWSIANEYRDDHYDSLDDYICELKQINSLLTDDICAERYLTVIYYGDI